MSTSRGDTLENVSANRDLFLKELGTSSDRLAQGVQVSRDGIETVTSPGDYTQTDALITTVRNVYLRVLTADCSPVLIWSTDHPLVAAVHSGWQGSELNILGRTIEKMKREFKVNTLSLNVAIGPGLSRDNFEVGPEFRDKFSAKYLSSRQGSNKFTFDNNRFLFDAAVRQGIPEDQIEILPYCSKADEDLFFSHRRDKGVTGRMMSVIGIRK